MTDTITIDSHHHLWAYQLRDYGWIGPEMAVLKRDFFPPHLEQAMQSACVSGSVAVQARQSVEETEWLLGLAESSPAILGVVGWLGLADVDFSQQLEPFLSRPKLKGLRHVIQDEPDDDFILREDFNRGIRALLPTGLTYDILIHERHLPQTSAFVARHPEQSFVLDHLAKPLIRQGVLQPWRDHLFRLADHRNVACKLSGMVTEANWAHWTLDDLAPYLQTALEAFGPERLMAGSDWPVCLVASSYDRWWGLLREWCGTLPPAARTQIMGANANRVYRLGLYVPVVFPVV